MPHEKNQMRKITFRVVLFLRNVQGEQFHRDGKQRLGSGGGGGTGRERTQALRALRGGVRTGRSLACGDGCAQTPTEGH